MNLQAIVLLNAFGFILLVFLSLSRFMTRKRRRTDDKIFSAIIWVAMMACPMEIMSFCLDGHPGTLNYWLVLLGNTYLYMANTVGCFLWTIYVDLKLYRDKGRLRRLLPKYAIMPGIAMLLLLINLFTGFLYYVDEQNVYHRQPLCFIMYAAVLFNWALSVVVYYTFRRDRGKARFFPLWMFLAPILVGSTAQGLMYGISVAWPATAIGVTAVYMSLQNERSYIDTLTGLFNRQFMEHSLWVMSSDTKPYYGIMMDLNYFKSINDTFGHSAGDRALINAAHIMRHAMPMGASVFRFAGDEFVMILPTDSEEDVTAVERRLRADCDHFNETTEEPFRLSFSLGHAKYEAGESEDDFLHRIDAEMYRDKERMHAILDAQAEEERKKKEKKAQAQAQAVTG